MDNKSIKDFVLNEETKGNVIVYSQEGLLRAKLDALLAQPIEGVLCNLNRDSGTILTFIDDPKWVNDYALSEVAMELKRQLDEANKKIAELENINRGV